MQKAVIDLYGSYDVIADNIQLFIKQALENGDYGYMYTLVRQAETESKGILLEYQEEKPEVINGDNVK